MPVAGRPALLLALSALLSPAATRADPPAPRRPAAPTVPTAPTPTASTSPTPAAPATPTPRVTGAELFPQTHDALPMTPGTMPRPRGRVVDRVAPDPSGAVPGTADAARYVRDLQDERFPGRAPGSSDYYRHLGQRVFDQWRPPSVSPPSVGDTLLTNFVAPTAVSIVAAGLMQGPLANGRGGAAIDALNQAHPNSPTLQPANNATAIAEATARVMRADVEIDQDEHGVLIAARLVRSSGSVMFDQRALAAVREAAGAAERRAMPGGWRSRWSFEVITSRDPAVLLAPTLPGETPGLLPAWIETTSDGEVHTALRVHQRRRVTLITSRQLHAR